MAITKGTIHVLTEKGSGNTPNKYSDLYPKTSADQVADLDTTIENKITSMISYDATKASGDVIGTLTIDNTDYTLYSTPDTHYTSKLIAGASNSSVNAATTNGNTYLRIFDDSTARSSIKIAGSGATSITSNSLGVITVNSTNTTYSSASADADGLMSSTDFSKLAGITADADKVAYTATTTTGTKIGAISINDTSTDIKVPNASTTTAGITKVYTAVSTNTDGAVTANGIKNYVDTKISDLVDNAPEALDTLKELADAIDNNASYAAAITTALSNKVDKETGKSLTSNDFTDTYKDKLDGITASADAVSYTATKTSGDVIGTLNINGTDYKLYSTSNTHYTSKLIAGASNSTVNASTTNGNTYLRIFDDSTARSSIKIAGSGATSVTSNNAGIITVNSTNTTYSVATTSANGLMSATDKSRLDTLYNLPLMYVTAEDGTDYGL